MMGAQRAEARHTLSRVRPFISETGGYSTRGADAVQNYDDAAVAFECFNNAHRMMAH